MTSAVARAALAIALLLAAPLAGSAQTIRGTLLDRTNDRPIDLGLVLMFTEAGDSVTQTITGGDGRFELTSPEPGSFLLAAAFGYRETPVGVFELGAGGEMDLEFRILPAPMPVDEIVVSFDRPVSQHHLIANGFVRRLQRGLGRFLTPMEIEQSTALSTEDFFRGIPGVYVQPSGGGTAFLGDIVRLRSTTGGWCDPEVYVDGLLVRFTRGESLSNVVPRDVLEAIEVYRRPSEVPLEYGLSTPRVGTAVGAVCGAIVIWTKRR